METVSWEKIVTKGEILSLRKIQQWKTQRIRTGYQNVSFTLKKLLLSCFEGKTNGKYFFQVKKTAGNNWQIYGRKL